MSGMFMAMGGTALTVLSTLKQGQDQKEQAEEQAKGLVNQANADAATAERIAISKRRQGQYLSSRAQALAAASGAGATDPTVLNIIGEIKGQSEYDALTSLYEGETQSENARSAAQAARNAGDAAVKASNLKAITTVLSAGAKQYGRSGGTVTLYDKYSGGGPGDYSGG